MQSLTGIGTTGSIFLGSELLLSAKGGPFNSDVSYINMKKLRMAFRFNIIILVQAALQQAHLVLSKFVVFWSDIKVW